MLQKFGYSQYESQVYEALVSSEESLDATAIVRASQVPKAKIYEVLDKLIEKGVVLNTLSGKKKFYSAVSLDVIIKKLSLEFEEDIRDLQSYKIKKVSQDDHVWTLKDEATIIATIDELIQDASHSILLSAWNTTLEHYRPLLEEKEREGISVEILTIGDLRTTLENTSTLHPMEHHEKLEPSQLVIVDEQSLLFAGIENETWKAIKTNSQPLVKVFTDFFYHDVALTYITKKYQEQLLEDEMIMRLLTRLRY
ncbi:TrmB family transcriptional regulator [Priestia flexa]|uniref:TrmB family transcriptional regulator n=1 Tax=Priestia flexa TaxID=86664 RepID=UPI002493B86C|nr:helix-turn-helix domain-containing protein [Priestia flexa]